MRRWQACVASLLITGLSLTSTGPVNGGTDSGHHARSPFLAGVSAVSLSDAWAVGYLNVGEVNSRLVLQRTHIEHWDGTSWQRVPSPNPGGSRHSNALAAVSAVSPRSAWAVGSYAQGVLQKTMILSWNGDHWTQVPSASPGDVCDLAAVTALSPERAWAAGDCDQHQRIKPLIEQWDGSRWTRVATPSKARRTWLWGVSADEPSDAWAVGRAGSEPFIEHWDGTAWKPAAAPQFPRTDLLAVDAVAATDVWAVGAYASGRTQKALVEHWDGTSWQRSKLAGLERGRKASNLTAVSGTSATDVWATGSIGLHTLIEHWDGRRWTRVTSPDPGRSENVLTGVSADSRTDAWTVGLALKGSRAHRLIAHWDGHTWKRAELAS